TQLREGVDQGPRDAVADRACLAREASAGHQDAGREASLRLGYPKWAAQGLQRLAAAEVFDGVLAVDHQAAVARQQPHPGDRGLAAAGAVDEVRAHVLLV